MSCELQRTQAECMKLFVRAARRIFSGILQFFRAILAQHFKCVISILDAERALFRNGTHCRFGQLQPTFCSMRSGCWPNARSFCARGAPEFRKFCNFFAQNLRDIDVRRALLRIWTHCRLDEELQRRSSVHAAHAGRFEAISLRAAR